MRGRTRFMRTVSGICLPAGLMLTEGIPRGGKLRDLPPFFTANFFIPSGVGDLSVWWLAVPGVTPFAIAFFPLFSRRPRVERLLLIAAGLLFYPLLNFLGPWLEAYHPGVYPLLWAQLFLVWAGMALWARIPDFMWSAGAADALWDLGAAVRALNAGVERLEVPYHPGLPPSVIIGIDFLLSAAMVLCRAFRVNPFVLPGRKAYRA